MAGLSKSRVLMHRQCPKRLWLETFRPELKPAEFGHGCGFSAGSQVGEIARSLRPNGVLMADDLQDALSQTRSKVVDADAPIFEATFSHEGMLIRADLLTPSASGWVMTEVKSATTVKPYYEEDAAIQAWVTEHAGAPLTSVEIAHIDNQFVYQGDGNYDGLLTAEDITDKVRSLQSEVGRWIQEAKDTLALTSEPCMAPGRHCSTPYQCPFSGYCSPASTEVYPVELLPRASSLAARLREEGFGELATVPPDRLAGDDRHLRILEATRSGLPYISSTVRDLISALPYPRYYLDFETINPAVPVWAQTRPYQQIPFQWSCHVEHADGHIEHHAYLSDGTTDPRPAFIAQMLDTLETQGPILVYNQAESPRVWWRL